VQASASTYVIVGFIENFTARVDFMFHTGQRGHITATSRNVTAKQFSNVILQCSALSEVGCLFGPALTWQQGNRTLQNNTKYLIKEQKKHECKHRSLQAEFMLMITNVTDKDFGKYFCQMECTFPNLTAKDTVELLNASQPGTQYCFCYERVPTQTALFNLVPRVLRLLGQRVVTGKDCVNEKKKDFLIGCSL